MNPDCDNAPPSKKLDNAYVQPASKNAEISIIPHLRMNSEKVLILKATKTISVETIILVSSADINAVFGITTVITAYKAPRDDANIILIVLMAIPDKALVSFRIKQFANKFSKNRISAYTTTSCLLSLFYTFHINIIV
jgi:hypothetical protein